jgi:hypothetical protein
VTSVPKTFAGYGGAIPVPRQKDNLLTAVAQIRDVVSLTLGFDPRLMPASVGDQSSGGGVTVNLAAEVFTQQHGGLVRYLSERDESAFLNR